MVYQSVITDYSFILQKRNSMRQIKQRILVILLCLLHIFLGINGLIGGILLIIKTDGSLLGMQAGWLKDSPFNSYLIPGFLLAFFLGILPLLTFIGIISKRAWSLTEAFNIYRDKNWSWSFSLYTGIIAISWITIQLIMTQYFWIQPVIIFTGLLIIIINLLPVVMKHFEVEIH
jgi:hypothetical protein